MREDIDFIDIQPTETETNQTPIEPSSEPRTELEANSTRTLPDFPCTRIEAGKALDVSDVTIGKWIKKIYEADITVTDEDDRITAEGFSLLDGYKEAKNKTRYVAGLIAMLPVPEPETSALATIESIRYESTIDLSYDSDGYYQAQTEQYEQLDNLETLIQQGIEATLGELQERDRVQQHIYRQHQAQGIREAAARGAETARLEYEAECRAKEALLAKLRAEGKAQSAESFRA
ncbi:hypothetical protein IQ249_22300 [Lusitaniella coriacea LEGE 07157]|uniref:Uncharacterized protein n=1 Tax=Lusitaniella coriacea LEGE 07157 TaxID=945747 RepID=A0A8J7E094_9CYAN|nr:hypothetical protein [Lusitaniella coriacea]MBE9118625.1 hypothetical protein [Lusitaniella coriacea LEGE 07157]